MTFLHAPPHIVDDADLRSCLQSLIENATSVVSLGVVLERGSFNWTGMPCIFDGLFDAMDQFHGVRPWQDLTTLSVDCLVAAGPLLRTCAIHSLRVTEPLNSDMQSMLLGLTGLRCIQVRVNVADPTEAVAFADRLSSTFQDLKVLGLKVTVKEGEHPFGRRQPGGEYGHYADLVMKICDVLKSLQSLRVLALFIIPSDIPVTIPTENGMITQEDILDDMIQHIHGTYLPSCERLEIEVCGQQWDTSGRSTEVPQDKRLHHSWYQNGGSRSVGADTQFHKTFYAELAEAD